MTVSPTHAAGVARFVDVQRVRTRGQVKFVFEVADDAANGLLAALGGLPTDDADCFVAIAKLAAPADRNGEDAAGPTPAAAHRNAPAEKPRRGWDTLPPAQQAGLRCTDPAFHAYLAKIAQQPVTTEDEAAEALHTLFDVASRKDIDLPGVIRNGRLAGRDRPTSWRAMDADFRTQTGRTAEPRG